MNNGTFPLLSKALSCYGSDGVVADSVKLSSIIPWRYCRADEAVCLGHHWDVVIIQTSKCLSSIHTSNLIFPSFIYPSISPYIYPSISPYISPYVLIFSDQILCFSLQPTICFSMYSISLYFLSAPWVAEDVCVCVSCVCETEMYVQSSMLNVILNLI